MTDGPLAFPRGLPKKNLEGHGMGGEKGEVSIFGDERELQGGRYREAVKGVQTKMWQWWSAGEGDDD